MTAAQKKTLTVVQKSSTDGHKPGVRATLLGLGLGRREQVRTLEDTPAVRGMIQKVRHLVEVQGEQGYKNAKKSGT